MRCPARLHRAVKRILRTKNQNLTILDLDLSILSRIYRFLTLEDLVCLSLSNKRFQVILHAVAKHKKLRFPQQPENLLNRHFPNEVTVSRTALLLRLENKRWAYCARCLKLHRRKEFPRSFLKNEPLRRPCVCFAGIVDLCQCITMTVHDRAQLIDVLQERSPSVHQGKFKVMIDDAGKVSLQHECSVDDRRSRYRTTIHITLVIEENQLMARTRYTRVAQRYVPINAKATYLDAPVNFCAHASFVEFGTRLISTSLPCHSCDTFKERYPSDKKMTTLVVDARRHLGSSDKPADRVWFDQCRISGYQDLWYWKTLFGITIPQL